MAQQSSGGAVPWLAFILGGLLVVVAVVAWLVWSGANPPARPVEVDVRLPAAPRLPEPAPMPNPQPTPVPDPARPQ
ncbi:MAG: hypothetical protein ACOY4K_11770 [Pseudomonadota bacterium]